MAAVSFFDAARIFVADGPALVGAFERVLRSGSLVLGPEVESFEAELAADVGTAHAVGVASGTDALELALRALGAAPGAEVVMPALTATATATAVVRAGLTPVLVDVDDHTLTMSTDRAAAAVGAKTAAIVTVHLYGRAAPVSELTGLGVPVIEDAAQSFGLDLRDGRAGSVGTIGCFSFYPTKNLAAFGDGGAVVTNDGELQATVRELRAYGESPRYYAVRPGMNSRLDELQAALLRVRLHTAHAENVKRREIAAAYDVALGEAAPPGVHHLYVVRSPRRDELRALLEQQGVQALVHYPWTIDQQPAFSGSPVPGGAERSHAAAAEVLSVPCHPFLTNGEVEQVAAALAAAARDGLIKAYARG
jgi:dTDP-4-amino-4,6-dideoxygalactose transaminase